MADERPDEAQSDDRGAVDHLLDLCVYAPLGLAFEGRSIIPTLAERGRAQVGVAKMVGQFAVKWGSTRVEEALLGAQEQAVDILRRTGVAGEPPSTPTDTDPADGSTAATDGPAPTEGPAVTTDLDDDLGLDDLAVDDGPPVDVDSLAIPDYDNLSASQVVPRLDGLTEDELEGVRRYERANRGRRTILTRIAQLQSPAG